MCVLGKRLSRGLDSSMKHSNSVRAGRERECALADAPSSPLQVDHLTWESHASPPPSPDSKPRAHRLTHNSEVDLGLPAAQLVLHQQRVAAAVLLACSQDGELAAVLAVLHLDVLTLLDLGSKRGAGAADLGKERKGILTPIPHSLRNAAGQAVWGPGSLGLRASPQGPAFPASRAKPPRGAPVWGSRAGAEQGQGMNCVCFHCSRMELVPVSPLLWEGLVGEPL